MKTVTVNGVNFKIQDEIVEAILEQYSDVEKEVFYEYPLFKQDRYKGIVVRFDGFDFGEVVWNGNSAAYDIGEKVEKLVEHTNAVWADFSFGDVK